MLLFPKSLCILNVSFDLFWFCFRYQQLISKTSKPQRSRIKRTANKVDYCNLSTVRPWFVLIAQKGFLIDWVSKCSLSKRTWLTKLPIASVSHFYLESQWTFIFKPLWSSRNLVNYAWSRNETVVEPCQ